MIQKVIKFLKAADPQDTHVYTGIALLAAGFYFVYPPAALIVPGALLIWLAVRR